MELHLPPLSLSVPDRMVDVFDLVLIVDCGEKREQVREPIHATLQRCVSKKSIPGTTSRRLRQTCGSNYAASSSPLKFSCDDGTSHQEQARVEIVP